MFTLNKESDPPFMGGSQYDIIDNLTIHSKGVEELSQNLKIKGHHVQLALLSTF